MNCLQTTVLHVCIARQYHVDDDDNDAEDTRGFNLSPIHGDLSARGFDQSHTEDTEMYQPITEVVRI